MSSDSECIIVCCLGDSMSRHVPDEEESDAVCLAHVKTALARHRRFVSRTLRHMKARVSDRMLRYVIIMLEYFDPVRHTIQICPSNCLPSGQIHFIIPVIPHRMLYFITSVIII